MRSPGGSTRRNPFHGADMGMNKEDEAKAMQVGPPGGGGQACTSAFARKGEAAQMLERVLPPPKRTATALGPFS